MRFSLQGIVNFILFLLFALGILVLLFWRLGIFKKGFEPSEAIISIKQKIEFVNNYPYQDLSKYFQGLSTNGIVIPDLTPEELGRPSLF